MFNCFAVLQYLQPLRTEPPLHEGSASVPSAVLTLSDSQRVAIRRECNHSN